MTMRLYDAHNHLQDPRLDATRLVMFADLRARGVVRVVVNGTQESDWSDVIRLAQMEEMVIPSIGLHPWFVKERSANWLDELKRTLDTIPCAIGEIGLDKWIEGYDLPQQEAVFVKQLEIATERDLPVSIHCLKAWGKLEAMLKTLPLPKTGFLLHSYGGPREMVPGFIKSGGYFSVSGHFLHPRKRPRFETFREIPLDRLLVETDAPDMCLPQEMDKFGLKSGRSRLNHPGTLPLIYESLAELLGRPLDQLAEHLEKNFLRLFGKLQKS
jgi:TatD DNase family protein